MHKSARLLVGLILITSPALAQEPTEWYGGATISRVEVRFHPDYTVVDTGERQQFDNRANNQGTDLLFGRRYYLTRRVSLAGQFTFSTNRARWELSIPSEPAELQYTLPFMFAGSAVPQIRLATRASLFGDLGAGTGRIREVKSSPATSAYDISRTQNLITVGVGVRLELTHSLDLIAEQRWLRYSAITYDTFNAAGAIVEHVTDAPRARSLSIGLTTTY